MRHALLCGSVLGGAIAACAAPMPSDFTNPPPPPPVDGGSDSPTQTVDDIPKETFGPGVTAADAALFANAPGADAPFVFDPPSGVVLPKDWPSPDMLTHTGDNPWLVRLELEYAGKTAAYTALPEKAQRSDPQTTENGAWWTIRFPASLFAKIKDAATQGEVKWRVLYAYAGDKAPAGAEHGVLHFLGGGEQPDLTYWEIASDAQTYSVQRLKVGASSTKKVLEHQGQGCIGCHTTTPDGKDIVYNDLSNGRRVDVVRPQIMGTPVRSPFVTQAAGNLLDTTTLLIPTVSAGAWSASSGYWIAAAYTENSWAVEGPFRIGVLRLDAAKPTLNVLANLDAGGSDVLPAWSPDGKRIVFVHTSSAADGYLAPSSWAPDTSDLASASVTIAATGQATFGAVTPVPFASGTNELETYPGFSSDGALLVYMRTPKGGGGYDEKRGEIFVMKADGSQPPLRIAANDAPSSDDVWTDGMTNSWPRFGKPTIVAPEGTYYPLVFSSRRGSGTLWHDKLRGGGRPFARLVYTVVLVTPSGTIQTFPGAIVPGQHVDAGSHCPDYVTLTSLPPPGPN